MSLTHQLSSSHERLVMINLQPLSVAVSQMEKNCCLIYQQANYDNISALAMLNNNIKPL